MHLILRSRASPDQRATTRDQPPPRLRGIVGRPHLIQEPDGQQLREDLRVDAIGLGSPRLLAHAFGLASTTRRTCGSRMRAIATAFVVASIATSSVSTNDCASSFSASGSLATRPSFPRRHSQRRARGRTRQLRIRALSTPGHSRGRPPTNCGRSAHRNTGLPNDCALHSPRSRDTNRTYDQARTTSCALHLHPPTTSARSPSAAPDTIPDVRDHPPGHHPTGERPRPSPEARPFSCHPFIQRK